LHILLTLAMAEGFI